MKFYCAIPACTQQDQRDCGDLSFHRFPNKNDPLREKWVKVVRTLRQDSSWEPRENNRICSRHFPGTVKHYRGSHGKMVGSPVPSLFPRRSDEVTQEDIPGGCFLCSISTLSAVSVSHSDQVKDQIHLYKDLLNREAFKKGLIPNSSSSLVYPSEGEENSCLSCLTTVSAVWAMDREIIVLKGRIKKMIEKSLNQHAEKFVNRANAEKENVRKRKQIDENISSKREKLEVCDQAVFDWMIAASTPRSATVSSTSTSAPAESAEVNSVTESHPHPESISSKPPASSIISTPFSYSDDDNHPAEMDLTDETIPPSRLKIEGDDDDCFVFEESEEMQTTAATPNFTTPVITSAKSMSKDQEYYILYEGDRPYGCCRCVRRFKTKDWVIHHMNTCKGVKLKL
ncbi:uncharacterized protein LOC110861058 [Folsomia candida]|uniref:THAP domain-containing protein 11 n=1 Tax=Folsomia candida TaxID=158441 RepID=A0A226D2E5_FOLCA|nr:uncharacterized protein LOC110861058 [Folsomia candida]OXA39762.1 THAP domain-containing protein 11 [Folsomia candida]